MYTKRSDDIRLALGIHLSEAAARFQKPQPDHRFSRRMAARMRGRGMSQHSLLPGFLEQPVSRMVFEFFRAADISTQCLHTTVKTHIHRAEN